MLIDCHSCRSRVDAKVHGSRRWDPDEGPPEVVSLVECPSCHSSLLSVQEEFDHPELGEVLSDAIRAWPQPRRTVHWSVPPIVSLSLQEADRCFQAGAYIACAVMCGRALEGVAKHFNASSRNLADGLRELLQSEVIDKRLYAWGDELRKVRNLGAHASTDRISKQDAEAVLDFVHAICEYVFVLSERFNEFMKRRVPKPPSPAEA